VRFIRTGDPGWEPFTSGESARRYAAVTETVPLPRAEALDALPPTRVR
jgi:hypothetical protein